MLRVLYVSKNNMLKRLTKGIKAAMGANATRIIGTKH